mmetsp:Transcript_109860/g.328493  ORF Transcript_109860/g.328493 Transcript_109860/m.328493 type:complete len:231 (-) Transcript_109860:901-1593(-)
MRAHTPLSRLLWPRPSAAPSLPRPAAPHCDHDPEMFSEKAGAFGLERAVGHPGRLRPFGGRHVRGTAGSRPLAPCSAGLYIRCVDRSGQRGSGNAFHCVGLQCILRHGYLGFLGTVAKVAHKLVTFAALHAVELQRGLKAALVAYSQVGQAIRSQGSTAVRREKLPQLLLDAPHHGCRLPGNRCHRAGRAKGGGAGGLLRCGLPRRLLWLRLRHIFGRLRAKLCLAATPP